MRGGEATVQELWSVLVNSPVVDLCERLQNQGLVPFTLAGSPDVSHEDTGLLVWCHCASPAAVSWLLCTRGTESVGD